MRLCKGRAGVWHPFRKQSKLQPGAAWLSWAIPAAVSAYGVISGKSQNEKQMDLSREQMEFQEKMSNTAYQRAVRDMKAADLNPMLAYSQGGASTPQGSQPPPLQNVVAQGAASGASAMSAMSSLQQMAQSKAQTEQTQAATEKIKSETFEQSMNNAKLVAEIAELKQRASSGWQGQIQSISQTELNDAMRRLREIELARDKETFSADVARRKSQAELTRLEIPRSESEADFYKGLGQANPYLRMLLELLKGASSARQFAR